MALRRVYQITGIVDNPVLQKIVESRYFIFTVGVGVLCILCNLFFLPILDSRGYLSLSVSGTAFGLCPSMKLFTAIAANMLVLVTDSVSSLSCLPFIIIWFRYILLLWNKVWWYWMWMNGWNHKFCTRILYQTECESCARAVEQQEAESKEMKKNKALWYLYYFSVFVLSIRILHSGHWRTESWACRKR